VNPRLNLIRTFLRGQTATQPAAPNVDAALNKAPLANTPEAESPPAEVIAAAVTKVTPPQGIVIVLGTIAFLYFARSVILPIFLACVAAMTLKPLVRWLSNCRVPPPLGAGIVLCILVGGVMLGFLQLGRPALLWINDAPQHLTELRQRIQRICHRARGSAPPRLPSTTLAQPKPRKRRIRNWPPRFRLKTITAPPP